MPKLSFVYHGTDSAILLSILQAAGKLEVVTYEKTGESIVRVLRPKGVTDIWTGINIARIESFCLRAGRWDNKGIIFVWSYPNMAAQLVEILRYTEILRYSMLQNDSFEVQITTHDIGVKRAISIARLHGIAVKSTAS